MPRLYEYIQNRSEINKKNFKKWKTCDCETVKRVAILFLSFSGRTGQDSYEVSFKTFCVTEPLGTTAFPPYQRKLIIQSVHVQAGEAAGD